MVRCIFCRIVKGEVESASFWEDEHFLAILDKNPNVKGMSLVITKKHFPSYIFDMEEEFYQKFLFACKKVSKLLERKLGVKRVAMVMEGMGIDHAHIKLYPLWGLKKKFEERWCRERVYFKKYPGFISTKLGHEANMEELKKLAKRSRE